MKAIILSAIKAEVRKVFDKERKLRQAESNAVSEKETILDEMKRLEARIGNLERRGIKLYEDFADGKLDRDGYLSAKTACAEEISIAKTRLEELQSRLNCFAVQTVSSNNEPLLRRIVDAEELTDEVLSLVDRIMVYDSERIEVQFAFGDVNNALGYN